MTSLNWVDNLIILILVLSSIVGLMRGFVKEVLSLLTWVAAFVVAILFASPVAKMFTSSSAVQSAVTNASNSMGVSAAQPVSYLSLGLSFVLLFVVTLIIGSIISSLVARAAEMPGVSFANRLLGAVFGFGRGLLIVLVAIFLVQLTPAAQETWWAQSRIVASYQPSVGWLAKTVQPGLDVIKSKMGDTFQNTTSSFQQSLKSFNNIYQSR